MPLGSVTDTCLDIATERMIDQKSDGAITDPDILLSKTLNSGYFPSYYFFHHETFLE